MQSCIRCRAGHVLQRLDLSYMTHYPSPIPRKSTAYLLPKYVGALLINCMCIGHMQADHS